VNGYRAFALALAVAAAGIPLHASEALKTIVDSYVSIQAKLAADDLAGAKEPARALTSRAASMGPAGAAIAKSAGALDAATDLKTARDAFAELSDAVIAAGKAEGWKDVDAVRLGYCPMVKRHWLQKDGQVRNPYYGAQMLTCGELKALPK
jgi:hypothetical protein